MGVLNYNPWILVVVIPDRFIKFINKLSGVTETIDSKGHPRTCRQEIYLFKRIQFFCNLRGAIARENALLQLKPMKFTGNVEF